MAKHLTWMHVHTPSGQILDLDVHKQRGKICAYNAGRLTVTLTSTVDGEGTGEEERLEGRHGAGGGLGPVELLRDGLLPANGTVRPPVPSSSSPPAAAPTPTALRPHVGVVRLGDLDGQAAVHGGRGGGGHAVLLRDRDDRPVSGAGQR